MSSNLNLLIAYAAFAQGDVVVHVEGLPSSACLQDYDYAAFGRAFGPLPRFMRHMQCSKTHPSFVKVSEHIALMYRCCCRN